MISKAFDSVIHDILIAKLKHLNFSDSAVLWFKSYLSNRFQCVVSDEVKSEFRKLACGVPQGSVLGPLLYSIYTYDIGNVFQNCKYHIYADDLQIYMHCKITDINECIAKINDDIIRLVNWTNKHGLQLNAAKTQSILVSNKTPMELEKYNNVTVNSISVPFSSKVKNLGIIIDDGLSWSPQVSSICQRVYYTLNSLYKFRALTPKSTRIKLVNSLVLPIIDYCLIVCCNMDKSCVSRLQLAMNNAVRYIYNIGPRERITPYYRRLGWLKVSERLDIQICITTHKILHGYAPPYLSNLFTSMEKVSSRQGSRSHKLYLQAPSIKEGIPDSSFTVRGYRLWNSLPSTLYDVKMTAEFKRKVEARLLLKYS